MQEQPVRPIVEPPQSELTELAVSQANSSTTPPESGRSRLWIILLFVVIAIAGFASSTDWLDFLNLERQATQEDAPSTDLVTAEATPPDQSEALKNANSIADSTPPLSPLLPTKGDQFVAECRRVLEHLNSQLPDSLEAKEMSARYEFEFGEIEKASELWNTILQVNPNFVYALRGLGDVATTNGKLTDAVRYYRRAVLSDPNSVPRQLTLGTAMLQAGQLAEAKQVLESIVQKSPDNSAAHAELGRVLLQLEEYQPAIEELERALVGTPENMDVHQGLATAYVRAGNRDKAAEHQKEHARLRQQETQTVTVGRQEYDDDDALKIDIGELYVDIARVYVAAGMNKAAELLLLRASRMLPENIDCRQALAFLAAQQSRSFDAIRWMKEVAQLQPTEFSFAEEVARLYMDAGQPAEAEGALTAFVQENPQNVLALRSLARFYLEALGNVEQAIAFNLKALELAPTADAYASLAANYERSSQLDKAIEAMGKALQLDPGNTIYAQLLALLREKSQPEASADNLESR